MAIEPFQRKVGIPDAAGGGMTRIADTRSFDLGPAISSLGETLMSTFEPILADEAVKRGNEEAGKVMFTRTENGQLVLPPPPEDGGRRYAAAFDKVIEARYLNEVGTEFQTSLDQEAADRRTGVKKYDATEFAASVEAKTEGMLSAMDPRIRPQIEEVLRREGLERTRSFTNEWSGTMRRQTLQGYQDLINIQLAKGTDVTLKPEEWEKTKASILELNQKMRDLGGASETEANALFMQIDNRTQGIVKFTESMEWAPDVLAAFKLMPVSDLTLAKEWISGVKSDGKISGKAFSPLAVGEEVTSERFVAYHEAKFGQKVTSSARSLTDPLTKANPTSYHSIGNGGRAIDTPAIPGMTFEQYVKSVKDDGFEVLEAIDEYKNPSKHSTGPHWHIAVGNTRKVTAEHTLPALTELTFEKFQDMDPSVRRTLEGHLNAELQKRDEAERIAAAEAREDARNQKLLQAQRDTQMTIEGALSNGVGGNWDAKETAELDNQFRSYVNVANLADPNERDKIINFVQQKNYLPEAIFNYLDNSVRSDNWQPAVQLYQDLQDATLGQSGARVGDLILSELNPKTAALLQQSDALARVGMSRPAIAANLEARRSGNVFTTTEAITEFNRQADNPRENGYQAVKIQMLSDALQTKKGYSIPATLMRDFDVAYTANLEITQQPAKAMQLAINQVKGRYQTTGLFQGNVGPSSLLRSYPRDTLTNFMFTEKTTDGNPLIRTVKGQKHRMFGSDPSVRLKPLDSNTKGVGRYAVYVYEPNNTANLIDVFEVDLGAEMRDHIKRKNATAQVRSRADLLAEARKERTKEVDFWTGFGQRADRMGGKM